MHITLGFAINMMNAEGRFWSQIYGKGGKPNIPKKGAFIPSIPQKFKDQRLQRLKEHRNK